MTNSGAPVSGLPYAPKPHPAEVMRCYDSLPLSVRLTVSRSVLDWDVRAIAAAMGRGVSAAEVIVYLREKESMYLARMEAERHA